jgi:hypothetical protein
LNSGVHGGKLAGPRHELLDLGRQTKQQRFVPHASDQLNADRQSFGRPVNRKRYRRLSLQRFCRNRCTVLGGRPARSATSLAVMPLRVTFKTSKIMNALAKDRLLE